jgi:thymidylate kinase
MSSEKGTRGALVVVEGLDRAGKSSQCELLYRSLLALNYKTKYIRFPGKSYTMSNDYGLSKTKIKQRPEHANWQTD